MNSPRLGAPRLLAGLVLAVAAVAIAVLVLSPQADLPDRAIRLVSRLFSVVPGVGGGARTFTLVEVGLNVALFVPVGVGLAAARPRLGTLWATGVGFWVSVALETAQALFLSDRSAQASDVFANALGCALGYVVLAWWVRRRMDSRLRERQILAEQRSRAAGPGVWTPPPGRRQP